MHRLLPEFESRVYTPQKIAAVVATLAEDGVAPTESLAGSDITEAALHAPETRVSYAQLATVFRNTLRLAPDPTIALRAGARMHVTAFGIWGYALLSSRSYADVLEISTKYRGAIGPLTEMRYDHEHNRGTYEFEVLLTPDPNDDLYRFAIEFTYAAHLSLGRDLYGESFRLTALRAVYPAPKHASAYRALLGCPAQFGQAANELQIDSAWIGRAPRLPDAVTHAMARETCQQFLTDLSQAGGTASTVRRMLVERMPWRFSNIGAMARELATHPRTLRRKLEAQGTSYRELLSDVRRVLAIQFLRKTRMTNEEIAARLGYSDAANFRHAFVRWTGKSPNHYRVH